MYLVLLSTVTGSPRAASASAARSPYTCDTLPLASKQQQTADVRPPCLSGCSLALPRFSHDRNEMGNVVFARGPFGSTAAGVLIQVHTSSVQEKYVL